MSPFVLMGWVFEWSRSYFSSILKEAMEAELKRGE